MSSLAGIATLGKAPLSWDARAKKFLTPEGLEKFKEAKKKYNEQSKATKESMKADFEAIFAANGVPMPLSSKEEKAIRSVVAAFLKGEAGSAGNVESTGMQLEVKGVPVATRQGGSIASTRARVCPGSFGAGKESRAAANAFLSLIGAGVRVNDRDGEAFIAAADKGSRAGRVLSQQACYDVQLNKAIRNRAVAISRASYKKRGVAPYQSGPATNRSIEEQAYEDYAEMKRAASIAKAKATRAKKAAQAKGKKSSKKK
jgi:hypothetical protein